jgi:ZIP family zinc transporter
MAGAFLWGAVAGSSLLLGGVIARRWIIPAFVLGCLTGFGAGALIAAVAFKLVDEAGELAGGTGRIAIGLVIGSLAYLAATSHADTMTSESASLAGTNRLLAVSVVPEAIVIVGVLLTHDRITAAVIVAVFACGVPEAVLATSRLLDRGVPERTIATSWASLTVLASVTAGVSYGLLDGASVETIALTLSIAGGAVLTNLATELIPEGHELAGRPVGFAVVIGFAVVFGLAEVT